MLTRRRVLTAGALGASMVAVTHLMRDSAAGPKPKATVTFDIPRGACDTHVHIIPKPEEFRMSPDRDYTPPPATAGEVLEVLRFLKFDRVVIVTPTIYGTDNSSTLDAIRQLGRERARGIALIDETVSPGTLDSMKEAGITGIRLFLYGGGNFNAATTATRLRTKFDLAKERGWHLDISTPPDVLAALLAPLASSPVPLVLDYFGWVAGGVEQPGFEAVLSLVKSGRAYVKLSEPYRISKKGPDYPDLVPVVQTLVAGNPDRVLWGSGWPHVDSGSVTGRAKTDLAPNLPIDAGHLLNLFAAWVPDEETRHKILVDNPARLYGF
jgi:predicted TIM-barrel fold metal-dependent hydrolase